MRSRTIHCPPRVVSRTALTAGLRRRGAVRLDRQRVAELFERVDEGVDPVAALGRGADLEVERDDAAAVGDGQAEVDAPLVCTVGLATRGRVADDGVDVGAGVVAGPVEEPPDADVMAHRTIS
jgi:hypothetical protein